MTGVEVLRKVKGNVYKERENIEESKKKGREGKFLVQFSKVYVWEKPYSYIEKREIKKEIMKVSKRKRVSCSPLLSPGLCTPHLH